VRAYHQYFISANPGHPWSKLPDELFLRRIGAIGMADDGCYYPTSAGLLMFGYEYEIVREFPQYFLDYQEDRNLLGTTRWTDRVVSSSGEWSGNLFDFVFKILPKLQNGLKIPFVLRGNQRIDDTPLHKLLREATVNTLSHADFYGRQGIVIAKDSKGFEFSNPGDLRISRQEAIDGGVSDPRNGVILKMFSLIRFGERAGSGLSSIFYVWQKVFHTHATLVQKESSAIRTVLTLPYDGHEQDVEAMLELYPDDITVDKTVDKPSINLKTVDKPSIKRETVDKPSIKTMIAERYSASHQISSLADQTIENMVIILKYLQKAPSATADDIIGLLGKSRSRVKEYMRTLLSLNLIQAHGANRTRSYTLASEIHI
jgi:predicted HTH transcriptional regulator